MRTELEVKNDILRGDYYRLERKLEYYESGKAFESLKLYSEELIKIPSNRKVKAEKIILEVTE